MRIDLGTRVGQSDAIMDKLLELPFELQAMLVAGYLAYRISVTGRDTDITAQDSFFQILVFGFVGWFVAKALPIENNILVVFIVIFGVSLFVGIAWRAFGRRWFFNAMRKLGVHTSDGTDNALTSIVHGEDKLRWGNVVVFTKDGHIYTSNIGKVIEEGVPTNETFIDTKGNIAFYVTRIERPDATGDDFPIKTGEDAIITYIPKTEIQRIDITWGK